jgi:hypothetical protein
MYNERLIISESDVVFRIELSHRLYLTSKHMNDAKEVLTSKPIESNQDTFLQQHASLNPVKNLCRELLVLRGHADSMSKQRHLEFNIECPKAAQTT